jgi:pyrroline-5-carboxylate reductase
MDAARNEKAMGRSTADTEAVAQAYRQFYGLEQAGPGISRVEVKANPKVADIFEGLSNALFESDKRLFDKADKLRGLTQKAIRELEAGDTTRALQEAAALGEQRAADLKAQIETIKQRAIEEGC